jgi:hypothetical protein
VPDSLNVQASLSLDTLAEEIVEPAASRVLARSPFGYGHDPDGAAASLKTVLAGAGGDELHAAAASAITVVSKPALVRLVIRVLIRPCPFPGACLGSRIRPHTLIKDIL